jgi:hydroxymethylpyrimidine/phosphomethylpyrimidine kinase
MSDIPTVLTIAGSDSSGGAGIQADMKSMSANRVYAASVITALTAQNTLGVFAIHDVPPDFITAQMDAVFSDLNIAAVKIGMLSRPASIRAVADGLKRWQAENIVLDPVMVAASGDPLIADEAVEVLKSELFPLARIVTPNLHEAARITGQQIAGDDQAMTGQAALIRDMLDGGAVLLKGGHSAGRKSRDLLLDGTEEIWLEALRIETRNTHGTGCSLSSAIAANLAKQITLRQAVAEAKQWLTGAIAASGQLSVGQGAGPVHHFYELWKEDK